MNDTFFLLILPTRTLTIHLGSHRQCVGMSLRGSCCSDADAAHLVHGVEQLLERHPAHAWIDSQGLCALSQQGQQALLRAHTHSQQAGTRLHWCGLPAAVLHQLHLSGLDQQLDLQPAADFEGPSFLLPARPAAQLGRPGAH
ncbi:STAS domain-containing protein [Hymenobacter cheonanensis]|uniref:STAS domain-containing protein n=1 Tax=Hymenobacter sp. CA2-7 TaxID=3063993 RepID=UPI002712729D|nr:STAS domain-containing protein [Hymenobacter sp. CA2-7]MDO7884920.1 STAS domain-containing protein [Hymenobacter sp. CA2-7]